MPKLRKPPGQTTEEENLQALLPEDRSEPTEPVTIDLPDEVSGDVTISLTEPEPVVVKTDDEAIKNALAAQQRAEELMRTAQRERDEAQRREQERQTELERERGNAEEAQYNSVLTAIAAETSALAKAEADQLAAANAADWTSHAKATREVAVAAGRLDRLEDNKRSFDTQRETQKTTRTEPQPRQQQSGLDRLPETAKAWLKEHPEFVNDQAKNNRLGTVHNYLVGKGVTEFSPEYFDALNNEFGFKQQASTTTTTTQQPQRKSTIMTAPVSRDAPSTSGTRQGNGVTLSAEERIIARNSFGSINGAKDLTNQEKEFLYAQNKAKLQRMRANGEYRQTTEQTG